MSRTTEFLMNIRSIIKLHESMLREICGEYQLALIEACCDKYRRCRSAL